MIRLYILLTTVVSSLVALGLWSSPTAAPNTAEMSTTTASSLVEAEPEVVPATSTATATDIALTETIKPAVAEVTPTPSPAPAPTLPTYTKETLAAYDGTNPDLPIYLAFDGDVYDVTAGRKFYEPGGAYHFLAGTDGTLLLRTFGGDLIKEKYSVVGTYLD